VPVAVPDPQLGFVLVVENPGKGMELGDEERPAGLQVAGDDPPPSVDVVEPAQNSVARVDDVELARERVREVVDIAADEVGLDSDPLGD